MSEQHTPLLLYIQDRQSDAMHLRELLTVMEHLDNEGQRQNQMTSLLMLARRMAADLDERLDLVNLPDEAA